ncbi:hypothetical protein JXA47_15025 [Candidatus Sumerlaeota bacterium]|nr:hypothetical protein [Candidatus Sumerlaeota bacterium]
MRNRCPFHTSLVITIAVALIGIASAQAAPLQPSDLIYEGAFRLPGPEDEGWAWGGDALTHCPIGDPDSSYDGYPGSLFGTGHNHTQLVSEISIPVPVISLTRNLADLNTATTLQDFHDIRGDLCDRFYWEIPRAGLAYLPPQGTQTSAKLHFCWGVHMQEGDAGPSHGWCELDLSNPQSAGTWCIDGLWNYVTTDYMFDIPQDWADAHTPGMLLATGRFRDGGQGSLGPSLIACGPWNEGNPPSPESAIPAVPLLLYGSVYDDNPSSMNGYQHADEWSGGAWITAGDRSAVIFVGTKGLGECWYGFSNGTVWPDEPPFPEVPPDGERGWWSTGFEGQILFYDPADLAAVANGEREAHEPQPYATLEIDDRLWHIASEQQLHHVGAACFDRGSGLLYVLEPHGDGDKPLVHVWRMSVGTSEN